MEHTWFGTMNGPDGKPFRTRESGVVLGDVIQMVVDAARKRIEEANSPRSTRRKNGSGSHSWWGSRPSGSATNQPHLRLRLRPGAVQLVRGQDGPLSAVRRGAREVDPSQGRGALHRAGPLVPPTTDAERNLIIHLLQFPEVVERTMELRAPNHIAEYAFETAGAFNRFYDTRHILSEEDEARRPAGSHWPDGPSPPSS